AAPCTARVVVQDLGQAPQVKALQPEQRECQAQQHPVEREVHWTDTDWAEAERYTECEPEGEHRQPRLEHKELCPVHKHRPQVDPGGVEWREPAAAPMVTKPALLVL